jgi:hypothetical protein
VLLSSAAAAQESRERQPREPQPREPQSRDAQPRVPGAFTPPAGLCRLWINGVPASQQPAPTDCASAVRNRPSNAAVLFGPPVRMEPMEIEPFSRRSGKLPVRQLAPIVRKDSRDDAARDDPRVRPPDTAVKPVPRKPEKPQ